MMPRLTQSNHHHRHSLLRLLWLEAPSIFALLTPSEQWDLHELYRPDEHLTEAEITEHLATLRKQKPSLASKVGKTFKLIARVHELLAEYDIPLSDHEAVARAIRPFDRALAQKLLGPPDLPARSNRRATYIRTSPIMKPQIDIPQLSRAIIALMHHQQQGVDSASDLPPRPEDDSRAA